MSALALCRAVVPPWVRWLTELRIDVHLPEGRIAAELDALNLRARQLFSACQDVPALPGLPPRLAVKARQVDGAHFVYVVDVQTERIVACVTLNRLIEAHRKADLHFRAPHTKVLPQYRRQGIATALYRWWLAGGRCLMTGARQSPAARGLWLSMARHYRLTYVLLEHRRIHWLGDELSPDVLGQLNARAVLLGEGREIGDVLAAVCR